VIIYHKYHNVEKTRS